VPTAVIDIGTNTLLLLVVAERSETEAGDRAPRGVADRLRRVVDLCRFGRLGKGLDASGRLDPAAIARSLDICREYRAGLDQHAIAAPAIVGTQALREAANAADFVAPAEQILGAPIEIIGGEREAQLAFTAVAHTFPELAGKPYLVVDVGGGSTELITTDGRAVVSAVSVPIGAVRLTERHLKDDPPTAAQATALDADIDAQLAPLALPTGVPVIGTAGTATTMAAVALGLTAYDPDRVTGFRMTPAEVAELRDALLAEPTAARRARPGMEPQRADVIAAGVAIYARVVRRVAAPALITCDRGIRWGIAYERAG
jgi:exopolyphosphatase / guanosine-5'-triphosphate,3'-diphosphate pyrophosphatase